MHKAVSGSFVERDSCKQEPRPVMMPASPAQVPELRPAIRCGDVRRQVLGLTLLHAASGILRDSSLHLKCQATLRVLSPRCPPQELYTTNAACKAQYCINPAGARMLKYTAYTACRTENGARSRVVHRGRSYSQSVCRRCSLLCRIYRSWKSKGRGPRLQVPTANFADLRIPQNQIQTFCAQRAFPNLMRACHFCGFRHGAEL